MSNAKTVNYTDAQTVELVTAYTNNPSRELVEQFAEKFNKSVRSIVAKLSREGVYEKKEYVSKLGEKPVAKDAFADSIGAILSLSEGDITSLTKANKKALQAIFFALANSKPV